MHRQAAIATMTKKYFHDLLTFMLRFAQLAIFICTYVLLDWVSFLHPLHGLNITLWNPAAALGLVFWLRFGPITALPWLIALITSEHIVRDVPAPGAATILLSLALVLGYGLIAEILRRRLRNSDIFGNRRQFIAWLVIIICGTLANSLGYILLLSYNELLPVDDRLIGFIRFWVGDAVGIAVTMPMFWMLLTRPGQERLRRVLADPETAGYAALAVAMLFVTFGSGTSSEFQYFYMLFLPVVWAAARQGLSGAATSAFILQAGIIVAVNWLNIVAVTAMEFQMLGAILALVGFFIGIVIDEQRIASEKLNESLRLAAAGEMAAALAHELNQPMTALAAYGDACEYLLSRGESGDKLRDSVRGMIAESSRAAEVVRRVRDFFRTGATKLDTADLGDIIAAAASRFAARAQADNVELQLPATSARVLVDRLQTELVLRNLLSNAFDALSGISSSNRQINISIEREDDNFVIVTVHDNGTGLTPSEVEGLFEPFSSTKSSGLGLGLIISRAMVEAHGGTLWAEPDQGGLFRFSLPVAEKDNA